MLRPSADEVTGAATDPRRVEPGVFPGAQGCAVMHDGPMDRRVLVIDDHPAFRASARLLLEGGGFDVVGEAGDGRAGLAAAAALRPDVVLLDIVLPDLDGFEVARQLAERDGGPVVVLVSTRDEGDYGGRVARARVGGFIQKSKLSIHALQALVG